MIPQQSAPQSSTVEDTSVTRADIAAVFGDKVADLVMEVTDISKPEDGNRKKRKEIDRAHLAESSPQGATIKLADLKDNTSSIVKYDEHFAKVHLAEKEALLPLLKHGNENLWRLANDTLDQAKSKLAENRAL